MSKKGILDVSVYVLLIITCIFFAIETLKVKIDGEISWCRKYCETSSSVIKYYVGKSAGRRLVLFKYFYASQDTIE